MSVYVLSDTHLSLFKEKPMDIFGARWDGHAEKIRRAWESEVGADDTVVVGGDVSWAMTLDEAEPDLRFLEGLPGQKILLRGNHDYWWSTARKLDGFKEEKGLSTVMFLHNNAYIAGNIAVCGTRGWYYDKKNSPADVDYQKIVAREAGRLEMSVSRAEEIADGREIVAFLHFPPVFCDFVCAELIAVLKSHGIRRCCFGHIHGVYDMPSRFEYEGIEFIPTSADYLEFRPLLLSDCGKRKYFVKHLTMIAKYVK